MENIFFAYEGVAYCGAVGIGLDELLKIHNIESDDKVTVLSEEQYKNFYAPSLEEAKAIKKEEVSRQTAENIIKGFAHEIVGQKIHFSYAVHDQQNYADTANSIVLARMGLGESVSSIHWKGQIISGNTDDDTGKSEVELTLRPEQFLELYTKGALAHKARCLETDARRKAAVEKAVSLEEVDAL